MFQIVVNVNTYNMGYTNKELCSDIVKDIGEGETAVSDV